MPSSKQVGSLVAGICLAAAAFPACGPSTPDPYLEGLTNNEPGTPPKDPRVFSELTASDFAILKVLGNRSTLPNSSCFTDQCRDVDAAAVEVEDKIFNMLNLPGGTTLELILDKNGSAISEDGIIRFKLNLGRGLNGSEDVEVSGSIDTNQSPGPNGLIFVKIGDREVPSDRGNVQAALNRLLGYGA